MDRTDVTFVRESFARIRHDGTFIDAFYDCFLAASPEVVEKFQYIDMDHQAVMMRASLDMLIPDESGGLPREDLVRTLAKVHGPGMAAIPDRLYALWLDSLITTLEQFDPDFDAQLEACWRRVVQVGIDRMIGFANS